MCCTHLSQQVQSLQKQTIAPHGRHDIARKTDAASRVARANIPATCGTCHDGIKQKYDTGIHAAALKKGQSNAPECADCHTAHTIQRADTDAWKLSVAPRGDHLADPAPT